MIDGRLPASGDEWPAGLRETLAAFEQGHLVAGVPFFYFSHPELPIFARMGEVGDGLVWHAEEFSYGAIVSQTCDLREEGRKQPRRAWIHVCPVYRADVPGSGIDKSMQGHVKAGRVDYLMEVPSLEQEGFWVADLRLVVPIEKSWLLGKTPIDGFADEAGRRSIGERFAAIHNKPAFDDRFVSTVQTPLLEQLRALAKADDARYEAVTKDVWAVAVRNDRLVEMSMDAVQVFVLSHEQLSNEAQEFWIEQSEDWSESALRSNDQHLMPVRFEVLTELSAADFLSLQVVPLRGMTPHPLWDL
ncbi:hypothetical protein LGT39_10365 [Demequina sp. TTPB684]|uniref:hypothetical protein n=1 Tax=unclassified Demequina TaxID=2620311 RepID=UPI001CF287AF|nr:MULTISPECIES: hypothetical protein [unclassified Demequina]MCB2413245.1 hypothetical protein [Demequina sp. TTPB684]UPU88181.1 hypothetical protein LGT36_013185 [Demequina sp. TMPB413]